MWINMNPNHEQISNWYTGWKSLMPPVIVEHPTIKGRFHSALDIMSRAVGGPSMPQPPPPPTIHVNNLNYKIDKQTTTNNHIFYYYYNVKGFDMFYIIYFRVV